MTRPGSGWRRTLTGPQLRKAGARSFERHPDGSTSVTVDDGTRWIRRLGSHLWHPVAS